MTRKVALLAFLSPQKEKEKEKEKEGQWIDEVHSFSSFFPIVLVAFNDFQCKSKRRFLPAFQ